MSYKFQKCPIKIMYYFFKIPNWKSWCYFPTHTGVLLSECPALSCHVIILICKVLRYPIHRTELNKNSSRKIYISNNKNSLRRNLDLVWLACFLIEIFLKCIYRGLYSYKLSFRVPKQFLHSFTSLP